MTATQGSCGSTWAARKASSCLRRSVILLAEDWVAIDQAFAANRDPNFNGGADREYRQLFARIVNLAPA